MCLCSGKSTKRLCGRTVISCPLPSKDTNELRYSKDTLLNMYRDYVIEEAILFSGASSRRDGVCFSSRINRSVQSALFVFFKPEPLSDCLQKTVWYDSKRIQAQAVINRPAPDDVTMIGFYNLPIADSLYITFLILLLSAA